MRNNKLIEVMIKKTQSKTKCLEEFLKANNIPIKGRFQENR